MLFPESRAGFFLYSFLKVNVTQSHPTVCDPMDYRVHGILQARILKWVVFPSSRGSFQPRDWIEVSHNADRFFTSWATREAPTSNICLSKHPPLVQTKWETFIKSLQSESKTAYNVCVVQSVHELWSTLGIKAVETEGPAVLGEMSWLKAIVTVAQ